MEQTLAILKPDCVQRGLVGEALQLVESEGFRLRALQLRLLTVAQAREFYAVHREKSFYEVLVKFMTSGPCLVAVLERDNAIEHWREVLVRFREKYSDHPTENLLHGSDAPETSAFERGYLFRGCELV